MLSVVSCPLHSTSLMLSLAVAFFSSNNLDKRTVAGRALGDLVKKLGDTILPEVVPHLHRELQVRWSVGRLVS